jgi:hypothetical protein
MDPISLIALTLGAGWASGINLYAAVLTLGLLHDMGWITLPPDLQFVGSPIVLAAAGALYLVEFVADKIPGVSAAWDAVHTFIRIPAGAILAASSVADIGTDWAFAAALAGGFIAAGTHFTKAGSRLLLSASPEPVSGWAASLAEDAAVVGILWFALYHPIVFFGLLAAFIALVIWLLPKLIRVLRRTFQIMAGWLRGAVSGRRQP